MIQAARPQIAFVERTAQYTAQRTGERTAGGVPGPRRGRTGRAPGSVARGLRP